MGARARVHDLGDRAGLGAARARRRCAQRAAALRPISWATGLGAASSSCSYAAVAIAKSLFQKGASAASALAFQFASTNLVWELGLVLWVLIGWQFTIAEYIGGIVMIVLMTVMLRLFVSRESEARARELAREADSGHQHHASGVPMSWRQRIASAEAWSDVAHNFRGDWKMLWKEITLGFLLAGFIAQLGNGFFESLFLKHAPQPLADDRERDRGAGDRGAELRLLGGQRAPGGGAVVRRDQLRRRAGVPVRRSDRAPDRAHLPQVLRDLVRAADHGADVRDDGHRGAGRRRSVQPHGRDPVGSPAQPRATSSVGRRSTTSCSSTCSASAIFAALLWITFTRGATDPTAG